MYAHVQCTKPCYFTRRGTIKKHAHLLLSSSLTCPALRAPGCWICVKVSAELSPRATLCTCWDHWEKSWVKVIKTWTTRIASNGRNIPASQHDVMCCHFNFIKCVKYWHTFTSIGQNGKSTLDQPNLHKLVKPKDPRGSDRHFDQ